MGPSYTYAATCTRVIDGDSYRLEADCGFDIVARVNVRLHGYSCPELGTPEGQHALDVAREILKPDVALVVRTYKTRTFARWLGVITLPSGSLLGDVLVEAGVAVAA